MVRLQHVIHSIRDIQFSNSGRIENGVLFVDRHRMESLARQDVRLVGIDLARPGEAVRIAPVLDIVEPRAKEGSAASAYPIHPPEGSGNGEGPTHILRGVAVVAVARIRGAQEGLLDMQSAAGTFSPFARTLNLVLTFDVPGSMPPDVADASIRESTLKIAEYLGGIARGLPTGKDKSFEWPLPEYNLPRTALLYLVQSQGNLRRTYFYGKPLDNSMPRIVSPLEILGGAVVSGNFVMPSNKTCTYIHQNHSLIREMYKRHGVSVNFKGVILANEESRLDDKKRVVEEVVRLVEGLNISGVIINQEGGANTLTDVMMLCRILERSGIKTVLLLNEFAGAEGATPSLAETTPEAQHIVSAGNNDCQISLPGVERFIGFETFPALNAPMTASIVVPLARVHSSTNPLGFNLLSCVTDGQPMNSKYTRRAPPLRVVHYLNQFFGQIGGEEHAHVDVQVKEGPVGPGLALNAQLGQAGEVVATVICGDNTMAEDLERKSAAAAELAGRYHPDLVIAGPCFAAGRYGMACGAVCKTVQERLGIPAVTGIADNNPAVDVYRSHVFMVPVGISVARTRQAIQAMTGVALALADGRWPEKGSILPRGVRELTLKEETGAARAVEMLADVLAGREAETELPLPRFDCVEPAPALKDLTNASIVLATEGGLTPRGNPDRIEMSMATKFGCYSLTGREEIDADLFTVSHGGFDNTAARENPNRILPLDVARELERENAIGKVADCFYTTAGNATSVENATRFGRSMAEDIRKRFGENVGVVFTST